MSKCIAAVLLVCAFVCHAEGFQIPQITGQPAPAGKALWIASLAALGAASVLDATSSWGKPELNPLLRGSDGHFGPRSATIKLSVAAAGSLFQWLVLRKHPKGYRAAAIGNIGVAAAFTGASIHNFRLAK